MPTLDPLAQLNVTTIVAVVVVFALTLWVLRRTCLVPLVEAMERRAAHIEAASASRAAAERALAAARAEAEALLVQARAEADRLTDVAKEEIAAARRVALERAQGEADAILAHGREEVAVLAQSEERRLVDELTACVTETLRRVVDTVDDGAVRLAVQRLLAAQRAR